MSIISAQGLSKSYGAQDVFSDISIAVPKDARVALVGKNGVGKTTLLRLIVGVESPDSGRVHRAKSIKVGYLPQEASYSRSKKEDLELTLWESSLRAFKDLVELEKELERLEALLAVANEKEDILGKYGDLQEKFELAGGYSYPHRIRQVLNGFGFTPLEYKKQLKDFSGGERTRAFFARLLLDDPNLLVLDEPTNHLDIRAIEWLEGWLNDWTGAAIIVSHDRYFMDRTVNSVWELSAGGLSTFRGNYSAYLVQRDQQLAYRKTQFEAQQEYIRKEEDYIQRNIAGQNTRQAQGRRKRLQRMLRDEKIDLPQVSRQVHIDFGKISRSGNIILETNSLKILNPEDQALLFEVPDLVLSRGECVVLMGPNGAGKTTLLKTLASVIDSKAGTYKLGASLKIGYFAQAHEDLDPDLRVIDEVMRISDLKEGEARSLLAQFLFTGDDVYKTVGTLSGGERGKLSLLKLILQGANLLLLDEPTNHLDIPSQEVLESALSDFPETIIMISHDRYLIDRLATQLWVADPAEKALIVFRGGYSEYSRLQSQNMPGKEVPKKRDESPSVQPREKKEVSLDSIEERVASLEEELEEISVELMEARHDYERVRNLSERYAAVEQDLQRHLEVWEQFASTYPEE
jgi:ATP-binding cassette subfamily F protein 3